MAQLPLSVVIDELDGNPVTRDRAFVRGLCRWLAERGSYVQLDVVERLGLNDVVVTFQMKDDVKLIVTGTMPNQMPGEVTLGIAERDFPRVQVSIRDMPVEQPYEYCTLDYALSGQRVTVTQGEHSGRNGTIIVAATVGERQENRVRLDSGHIVTCRGSSLELVSNKD
jgi:hypothetical protein